MVAPGADVAELGRLAAVTEVVASDDLHSARVQAILDEQVFARSRSAFTEDEEAVVLAAAAALAAVDPLATGYELSAVEPSLTKALTGYSEEVSAAAVGSLAAFGREATAGPLSDLASGDGSVSLRAASCRALAAVLGRSEAAAPEDVVAVLKGLLGGDEQALKEAAAEALSAAGLSADDVLALVRTEGMGLQ